MWKFPLCVLDTETTGFLSDPDARVVELAACVISEAGDEVATFSSLVKPDVISRRADRAFEVTGIDRAEVMAAPAQLLVYNCFRSWWSEQGSPQLTAFNIPFDWPMLKRMSGTDLRGPGVHWGPCVMAAAQHAMGAAGALEWFDWKQEYKWPRLSEAANFYEVPQHEPAHRALADARTAAAVAHAIWSRRVPAAVT